MSAVTGAANYMTLTPSQPDWKSTNNRVTPQTLRAQISRQRDHVLDLDLAVDLAREDLDRYVTHLHVAVFERDRAAAHLAGLLEWCAALEGVEEWFGPEISAVFAAATSHV
jgi:hypothetical protein